MDNIPYLQICLSLFSVVITAVVAYIGRRIQKHEDRREVIEERRQREIQAVREALLCMLRSEMIRVSNHAVKEGKTAVYMVENMSHMFNAYKNLGGNGAMESIYERFMKLPMKGDSSSEEK